MGLLRRILNKNGNAKASNAAVTDEAYDYDDDSEALDVYEAADIWRCSGEDEDYMFGFTEDELRRAL